MNSLAEGVEEPQYFPYDGTLPESEDAQPYQTHNRRRLLLHKVLSLSLYIYVYIHMSMYIFTYTCIYVCVYVYIGVIGSLVG